MEWDAGEAGKAEGLALVGLVGGSTASPWASKAAEGCLCLTDRPASQGPVLQPHRPPDASSQGRRRTSSAQPGDPGRPLAIRMVGRTQEKNLTLTFYKWPLNTADKTGLLVDTQGLRNRVTAKPW